MGGEWGKWRRWVDGTEIEEKYKGGGTRCTGRGWGDERRGTGAAGWCRRICVRQHLNGEAAASLPRAGEHTTGMAPHAQPSRAREASRRLQRPPVGGRQPLGCNALAGVTPPRAPIPRLWSRRGGWTNRLSDRTGAPRGGSSGGNNKKSSVTDRCGLGINRLIARDAAARGDRRSCVSAPSSSLVLSSG